MQKCWVKNHFAGPNWNVLTFSSNFNLSGQILNTGGVALNHCSLLILTLLSCSSLFMQMLCTQDIEKPYRDTNSKKKREEEEDDA